MLKSILLLIFVLFSFLPSFAKEAKEIKLPQFSDEVMKQGQVEMKSSEKCITTHDLNSNSPSVSCSTNENLNTDTKSKGYVDETSSFMHTEMQKYRSGKNSGR